eukprot:Amastigsp_a175692_256.p3 type:complete len:122 gc:universal Amastigsp_a175692_256:1014-1379(+)
MHAASVLAPQLHECVHVVYALCCREGDRDAAHRHRALPSQSRRARGRRRSGCAPDVQDSNRRRADARKDHGCRAPRARVLHSPRPARHGRQAQGPDAGAQDPAGSAHGRRSPGSCPGHHRL